MTLCESGWTGDRCQLPLDHEGPHDNELPLQPHCGCSPASEPAYFDEDGDGIAELCRRCGEYIVYKAEEPS